MKSISGFITNKLRLEVNEEKSAVDRPWRRKFLGFPASLRSSLSRKRASGRGGMGMLPSKANLFWKCLIAETTLCTLVVLGLQRALSPLGLTRRRGLELVRRCL